MAVQRESTKDYRRALEAASKEYEALGVERRRIDQRLTELAHTIGTLTRLCGFTPTVTFGLTDACRAVLRSARAPLTPAEVRDRLAGIGFEVGGYANPLAAIHTTLKRLAEAEELKIVAAGPSGKLTYVWHQPPRTDMLARIQARVNNDLEALQARAAKRKKR
jgi:hypothetical protein